MRLFALAVLVAVGLYLLNNPLPHISPFVASFLIAGAFLVALVVFVLLFIRFRSRGKGFLSSVFTSLFIVALIGGIVAFFIYQASLSSPEVDMTRTAFTQTSVDASTGAHVHFVNPSNGVEQILCIGSNGHCTPTGSDPSELDGAGLRIEPGQTITVVFPDSGDYPITSRNTPSMNTTIHVQENDGGGD